MTQRNTDRIHDLTLHMIDLLEDERADDAITALVQVLAQELTYMCPNCRNQAFVWLNKNMPKMMHDVEDYVRQRGEVADCDGADMASDDKASSHALH